MPWSRVWNSTKSDHEPAVEATGRDFHRMVCCNNRRDLHFTSYCRYPYGRVTSVRDGPRSTLYREHSILNGLGA